MDPTPTDGVKPWKGLSPDEVERRRSKPERATPRVTPGLAAAALVSILVAFTVVLGASGRWPLAVGAGGIVGLILAAVGLAARARRARRIRRESAVDPAPIPVRRAGRLRELVADDVVPGDVIILAPGRRVPADAIVVDSDGLIIEESAATGEILIVEKRADPDGFVGMPLADRATVVFTGSVVREGYGTAIVLRLSPTA
ncbi:MAG TPA: hypothetical protein VMH39_15240 [Gemmatimonadaceae bacterium]|nr:hypothetical protein [Gemmatimonadaceae bacterium]